ncbi:MAG: 2-phosphosulfolactate phosphatase family protein [Cyanobacteria bacterium P01_H01_bin.121]
MNFSLYHTPEQTPTDTIPDCAIVIDVLRATTTIAQAFSVGAEAVQAFSDIDQLLAMSEQWPAAQRIRIGERGGKTVAGCDFGNSPRDCTPERFAGCRIFMSTTNGTRALQRVQSAPVLLTAALTNRQRVVDYLLETQPNTVWFVASGWEGSFALEDTVCAGAVVHAVSKQNGVALPALAANDELVAAVALFEHWQDQLVTLLHHASHGHRLLRLNNDADLQFCATLDSVNVLPMQRELGILVNGAA